MAVGDLQWLLKFLLGFAYVMFAHLPLSRANHMAKPDIGRQGNGLLPHGSGGCRKGSEELGQGNHLPWPLGSSALLFSQGCLQD